MEAVRVFLTSVGGGLPPELWEWQQARREEGSWLEDRTDQKCPPVSLGTAQRQDDAWGALRPGQGSESRAERRGGG